MNIFKKALPALLALSLFAGSTVSAATFPDMPNDWTTQSLQNAVTNGLLSGFDDGTIRPNNNITRAQMATIIVRCFGAVAKSDISEFTDVPESAWYHDAFSKAVYMKAFNGDDKKQLNPNNPITFQECFKVVASVFGLIAKTEDTSTPSDLALQDLSVLNNFADGAEVSDWAKPYVASIVANGYWNGLDGKLTPRAYITRAQFAVLMNNMVTTYINEPGTYSNLPEGNIMIKTSDVTIENYTTNNNIIIADSAQETENGINFKNCTMNGKLVIRGGGRNVKYQGFLNHFVILNPFITIELEISNLNTVTGYSKYKSSSCKYYIVG